MKSYRRHKRSLDAVPPNARSHRRLKNRPTAASSPLHDTKSPDPQEASAARKLKKAPARKFFRPKKKIKVKGATAPSGTLYVHVFAGGLNAWVPYAAFRSNLYADLLQAQGIVLLKNDAARVWQMVEDLGQDQFPAKPLIERPGWSGRYYALPDGKVYGAKAGERPIVLFHKRKQKVAAQGSLQDWQTNVAEPLVGQTLPTFVLMLAFAGPLMRLMGNHFNVGVEISGPPARGKSTLLYLASSVWGPANSSDGANYWQTANATMAGFEGIMSDHSDMTMVIDETNLLGQGQSKTSRADTFNHFVFAVSSGIPKAKHQAHRTERHPLVYLTSTNEPLATILGAHREQVSQAAAERLNTVPISAERSLGCFDTVPKGCSGPSEFATYLGKAIAQYHGRPIREYLKAMVKERNRNPQAFKDKLERLAASFRKKMRVDESSGSETRVAMSFGLIYAAGRLAKAYGVLPGHMKVGNAATAAYELNRAAADQVSPLERLLRFARRPDLLRSVNGKWPKSSYRGPEKPPGYLWEARAGTIELLMTDAAFKRAFRHSHLMLKDIEVQSRMRTEGSHKMVKRSLPGVKKRPRVLCFRLDEEDMD